MQLAMMLLIRLLTPVNTFTFNHLPQDFLTRSTYQSQKVVEILAPLTKYKNKHETHDGMMYRTPITSAPANNCYWQPPANTYNDTN